MRVITALLALLFTPALPAGDDPRYIAILALPSGRHVVVAEGDQEARSLGSFSVRLYESAAVPDATTFFLHGLIHSRDGTLEQALLKDVDGDGSPDVLVTARSAGSGNYLSSYAFAVVGNRLCVLVTAEGLAPDTDPSSALRERLQHRRAPAASAPAASDPVLPPSASAAC